MAQLKPKLSAFEQMLLHVLLVFVVAFGGQMTTSVTGAIHISAVFAVLTSSAAAGAVAVVHYLLGLIPHAQLPPKTSMLYMITVPPAITSRFYQLGISFIVTFLSMFGSVLVAGAVHVTSLPALGDLIYSAISAAVAAVVQYGVGLIPKPVTPTPTPTPTPSTTT